MPKDDRLYAKFCVDISDHPKFVGLSDPAFRMWFDMVLWSRRQLTDGFIPDHMIGSEAKSKWLLEFASELLQSDAKKPLLFACENGYKLHDFSQHQTTRSEVDAVRAARIDAGRRGGLASAEARRKQTSSKRSSKTRSKTKPETETDCFAPSEAKQSRVNAPRSAGAQRVDAAALCSLCDQHGVVLGGEPGDTCGHPLWRQPEIFNIPSYDRPDFDHDHQNEGWTFVLQQRNGHQR